MTAHMIVQSSEQRARVFVFMLLAEMVCMRVNECEEKKKEKDERNLSAEPGSASEYTMKALLHSEECGGALKYDAVEMW